jgi:hypothetical protein
MSTLNTYIEAPPEEILKGLALVSSVTKGSAANGRS